MSNLRAAEKALAASLRPQPRIPLSQWADKHRRLSSEASSAVGQWTTIEYQREPLDACGYASPYEAVVLEWASQTGKTEALLNVIAETISENPGPMLMIQPTLTMVEMISTERIGPVFSDTPILKGKVVEPKGRDAGSTTFQKRFIGGQLSMVGSNSPAGLASRPIKLVLADEVDRYEDSAGAEGDPVQLAIARTTTFWNRKVIFSSSPTIKGDSRIDAAFQESDQRYYHVPCPHCNALQRFVWSQVEWPEKKPKEAYYVCIECNKQIPHHLKARMVKGGKWIKTNPESAVAGFHISSLYSPWLSWGELAEEWYKAQGKPERLRAFINTRLAELWDDEAIGSVSEEELMARREPYGPVLPAAVAAITAGVDIQGNRIEVSFYGWGDGEESWLIEHVVVPGDTTGDEVWDGLDRQLLRRWKHPVVGELSVKAAAVDTGYLAERVTRFCEMRRGRAILAIKGEDGSKPIWPRKESKARRGNVNIIGVDSSRSIIAGRLKIAKGPGRIHLPMNANIDLEFIQQLTSEFVRIEFRRGKPVRKWERRKGRRAEAWDCANYALAALYALRAYGFSVDNEAAAIAAMRQVNSLPADTDIPKRASQSKRSVVSSSWMRGF